MTARAAHHVELLLEFLIGIVNTKLFKAVDFKCLKPLRTEQTYYLDEYHLMENEPARLNDQVHKGKVK